MYRLLVALPSPRDIQKVKEHIDALDVDRLWVKYLSAVKAYKKIRDYFLEEDYDYLIVCPDDLVVLPKHLYLMRQTIKKYGHEVICGMCNVDQSKRFKGFVNVSLELPTTENLTADSYKWLPVDFFDGKLVQVKFAGFPFMAIRRDIVEMIPFRDFQGVCFDLMFCTDLDRAEIPIYVNPEINMEHLKIADSEYDGIQVGHKKPVIYLQKRKMTDNSSNGTLR